MNSKIREEIIDLNNQIQEKSMKINEIRKDIQKSKYITIIIIIIIIMIFFLLLLNQKNITDKIKSYQIT